MSFLARRSQEASLQPSNSRAFSFGASRSTNNVAASDPLQPLRAMADRVGKEVEKFAERVDHWHTHGNESERAKYHTTVKMVGKFRDLAESTVKELKKQSDVENKGDLNKSVRRRIQNLNEESQEDNENIFGRSSQSIVPSIEPSTTPESPSVRELRHWQAELATWELVRILIDHHHPEPGTDVEGQKKARLAQVGGTSRYSSKSEVWDRFIIEDDSAREKKIVLKWLHQTARNTESDIDSIIEQWESVSGKDTNTWTSGWLDTKAKIKQAKRMNGSDKPLDVEYTIQNRGNAQSLTTRLDPDGPGRQKRVLEKSDEYYENAIWMICYEMLRRGEPWDKVSDWCKERNEAWRAVSIGAANESQPADAPNMAGNDFGYLYRRMCFYAALGSRNPYEGAVYALLSGNHKEVLPMCRSWDDHLYAYYNALLLSRFDRYLLENPQPNPRVAPNVASTLVFQDAVAIFGDWDTSNKKIIELLKKDEATVEQARAPMKLIQGALISGTIDELVYKVGIAIADIYQDDERLANLTIDPDTDENLPRSKKVTKERSVNAEVHHQQLAKDPYALRILVHIFITLQNGLELFNIDTFPKQMAIGNVITTYIEFLRVSKRPSLIPLYAAQLSRWRGAHCLARILPDIKNHDEQKRCVNLMDQYRIDTSTVLANNFLLAMKDTSLVRLPENEIPNPIKRYKFLEKPNSPDSYLWPGQRIRSNFPGLDISAKEEALVDSMQWYGHLDREDEDAFESLYQAVLVLLLNGRVAAAEKIVSELSVEKLSLAKTALYCGYAFDFTQAGAEEQDEEQVSTSMRKSLRSSGHESLRPSEIPSAQEHERQVLRLRGLAQPYFDLSQVVRLLSLFRQWRLEEDNLISSVHIPFFHRYMFAPDKLTTIASPRMRNQSQHVSTTTIKDLAKTIEATFNLLVDPSYDPTTSTQLWDLYKAYIPELVLGYLSVLQAGSFFIHRDTATKAMDLATVIADDDKTWLQRAFVDTGRMSELVETLANVSKAMLKLGEHGDGKSKIGTKKRGSKGETLRIWDINVRN